jgi:hypothetical protein
MKAFRLLLALHWGRIKIAIKIRPQCRARAPGKAGTFPGCP